MANLAKKAQIAVLRTSSAVLTGMSAWTEKLAPPRACNVVGVILSWRIVTSASRTRDGPVSPATCFKDMTTVVCMT